MEGKGEKQLYVPCLNCRRSFRFREVMTGLCSAVALGSASNGPVIVSKR